MWNDLSMKDKAAIIALGVKSGVTDLDNIKSGYNEYLENENNISPPTIKGDPVVFKNTEVEDKRATLADTLRNNLTSIINGLSENTYDEGGDLNRSLEDARNSTVSYSKTIQPRNVNGTEKNPVELSGVTVYPRNVYLDTYYPFNKGNFIGHSSLFLKDDNPYNSYSDAVDVKMHHKGYNLVNNNCSNATNRVLENYFNADNPTVLFTTPGDVQDFWQEELKKIGRTPVKVDTGEALHDRSFISLTGEEFERMAQAMGKESDKYYSEKKDANRREAFSDWRKNYGFIPNTN